MQESFILWSVIFFILFTLLFFFFNPYCFSICPDTLPILSEIHFQDLIVSFKAQDLNWWEDVLSINSFSLLVFTFFTGLARNERNELRYTLLHSLLRVFCDFSIIWKSLLHDSANVRNGQKSRVVSWVSKYSAKYLSCFSCYYINNKYNTIHIIAL